ncbi:MAG: HlyD family type I secretion periplasmic adaptor subunit [Pseudomonadota bacterium]
MKTASSVLVPSFRRLQIVGMSTVLVLIAGVGGWASSTEISGAIIAQGSLVVEGNTKKIQHQAGGRVGEILARNGDVVKAGDVLVRLNATQTETRLAMVTKRLSELRARHARLEAERDGLEKIIFPPELSIRARSPIASTAMRGETRLFELRRTAREGQKEQLRLRVQQLKKVIEGLRSQETAKKRELKLVATELTGARRLFKNGLMPISKYTSLEREQTRVEGEFGNLGTTIARVESQISETRLQLIQIDQDLASEVASQLRDVQAQIGEFVERQVSAEDELAQIEITAPVSGMVHESKVDTVRGVVRAGDVLMQIVPSVDRLVVEARVAPPDIDQLSKDQEATLKLTAFNINTTPDFIGTVEQISPNAMVDDRTGQSYYKIRVRIDETDIKTKLKGVRLKPGMPVEAYVRTRDRSVMSYLMKPIRDQFNRAFREE